MKREVLTMVAGAFLPAVLLAFPGYAAKTSSYVSCSYQENGKAIIISQCLLESRSAQGMTSGTLTWKDGVKTKIEGNFSTLKQWFIDDSSATVVEWPNSTQKNPRYCLKSDSNGTLLCWWKPKNGEQRYNCPMRYTDETASKQYKKVRIEEENIEFQIPQNYRTMKLQDGSTVILHPSDFDFLQCMARGGRGGRGYRSQSIQIIDRNELTILEKNILSSDKKRVLDENLSGIASFFAFKTESVSGYVVLTELKYSAYFLGIIPGSNKILKIVDGCDCEVNMNDFIRLLSTVKVHSSPT